jgi:hypothetical protein
MVWAFWLSAWPTRLAQGRTQLAVLWCFSDDWRYLNPRLPGVFYRARKVLWCIDLDARLHGYAWDYVNLDGYSVGKRPQLLKRLSLLCKSLWERRDARERGTAKDVQPHMFVAKWIFRMYG